MAHSNNFNHDPSQLVAGMIETDGSITISVGKDGSSWQYEATITQKADKALLSKVSTLVKTSVLKPIVNHKNTNFVKI